MKPYVRPAVLALVLALAGCGGTPAGTEGGSAGTDDVRPGFPVQVTNCGRTVTVAHPPTRAVGLYPAQTEVLLRLGLGDRVVGQAQTAVSEPDPELAEQLAAIPSLSEDAPPGRETLLAHTPDFVYSPTGYEFTAEQGFADIEQLGQAGAAAYTASAGCFGRRSTGTVEDMFTDIRDLGRIFDVEQAATELSDGYRAELAEISAAVQGREPVRVAQVFVEGNTLTAIGGSVEADIVRLAGGQSVFSPDEAIFEEFFAAQVGPEVVAARDPQAFVYAVTSAAQGAAVRDYLIRTFPHTRAVREGRLIGLPNAALSPGSLSAVDAVRTVAEVLHPGSL